MNSLPRDALIQDLGAKLPPSRAGKAQKTTPGLRRAFVFHVKHTARVAQVLEAQGHDHVPALFTAGLADQCR